MSISKKILIIAGEESGDMYGANIIQKLSKNQNITFYAMGSSKMQMTNAKIIVKMKDVQISRVAIKKTQKANTRLTNLLLASIISPRTFLRSLVKWS